MKSINGIIAGAGILSLAGCAGINGGPNMQTDQLKAIAADKNASVVCSTIMGPWGTGKVVIVNLDQRVIADGSVSTDSNCVVNITNAVHDKAAKPATP